MKLSDDALAILEAAECLTIDRTPDRHRLTGLLVEELQAHHVAHSVDEVGQVEIDAGQLTKAIIGSDLRELVDVIKNLLSPGANGAVQKRLMDGYMLCAGRTTAEVEISGEIKRISFSTKFLSDDRDVIRLYVEEPGTRRLESSAASKRELGELIVARRPEMAEEVGQWIAQLHSAVQRALGSGDS
jgi:hypothetical protein